MEASASKKRDIINPISTGKHIFFFHFPLLKYLSHINAMINSESERNAVYFHALTYASIVDSQCEIITL